MCSHYELPTPQALIRAFGTSTDFQQQDLWPGYSGPFIRIGNNDEDESAPEIFTGVFGLLPFWAKDEKLARRTYNARSETVAEKPSFRSAWAKGQHCVIPAAAIYEPDWRSGKAVPTRIVRADGGMMCVAGLWERWASPEGKEVLSYTMLTINADDHPFMSRYHRPDKEKRMVVILSSGAINGWLKATAEESRQYLRQYPADRLAVSEAQ